jgi:hypothetical protein
MKYPNWNEYDNAKKWKAVAAELTLETNNATTKADLTNMVKFLGQEAARLQAEVYKAEEVYERVAGLANCRRLVGNSAPVTNKFLNELCDFWEAR